jgi:ribonuclease P protein component
VLAKSNRLAKAEEYRSTVRHGRLVRADHTLAYVVRRHEASVPRFGFIVSKKVGNAVTRNKIRRRLKAASYAVLSSVPSGTDVVFRARPTAASASWATLQHEVTMAVTVPRRGA